MKKVLAMLVLAAFCFAGTASAYTTVKAKSDTTKTKVKKKPAKTKIKKKKDSV